MEPFKDATALIALFEVLPISDSISLFSPMPVMELVRHPRNILELKIKSYNFCSFTIPLKNAENIEGLNTCIEWWPYLPQIFMSLVGKFHCQTLDALYLVLLQAACFPTICICSLRLLHSTLPFSILHAPQFLLVPFPAISCTPI